MGENISLAQFVNDNFGVIAQHTSGEQLQSFENIWSARLGDIASRLGATVSRGKPGPDHHLRMSQYLSEKMAQGGMPNTPERGILSSTASKSDSHELTPEAKAEFSQRYHDMDNDRKWKLKSGNYVEDVMLKFGNESTHEHAAHSFILNVSDPCWKGPFTEAEIQETRTYGNYSLPPLDEKVEKLFSVYRSPPETGVLRFVKEQTKSLGPYDPEDQKVEFKQLDNINKITRYYFDDELKFHYARPGLAPSLRFVPAPSCSIPSSSYLDDVTAWTEQDFVTHVWCVLDRLFQSSKFTTTRDKTGVSTSMRVNGDRNITDTSEMAGKKRGIRPDLMLVKSGL